jgi:hypothetical protein
MIRMTGRIHQRKLNTEIARLRDLSQIARAITGTGWNGLVFFGVKASGSNSKNASHPKPVGRGSGNA